MDARPLRGLRDPVRTVDQVIADQRRALAPYTASWAAGQMNLCKAECRSALRWRRACYREGRIMAANGWLETAEFALQRWKFFRQERNEALAMIREREAA